MGWVNPSAVPQGTTMLGLCGWFHGLAVKAYKRTSTAHYDREAGQHDALTAIMFSVVTLESFMGELEEYARMTAESFGQATARQGKLLADTLELIEEGRGQLTLKFLVAKLILTSVSYETGTKPFQDFELLLKIRNSLTHPRPFVVQPDESGSPVDPSRKFREQLRSLNILAEVESSSVAPLSTWIQTRAAARWACTTAFEMAQSLFEPSNGDELVEALKALAARAILPLDLPTEGAARKSRVGVKPHVKDRPE